LSEDEAENEAREPAEGELTEVPQEQVAFDINDFPGAPAVRSRRF